MREIFTALKRDKRNHLTLSTPYEIRKVLSRVANMALNGEIDTKIANTIIMASNAILSGIRTDEQQKKIEELEELLNSKLK